jgi:hypothetical protein
VPAAPTVSSTAEPLPPPAAVPPTSALPPPKGKQFGCTQCPRAFKTAAALQQHKGDAPGHGQSESTLGQATHAVAVSPPQHGSGQPAAKTPTQEAETATPSSSLLPPAEAKGSSACDKCSRVFGTAEALQQHQRDAPGHRPGWSDCKTCSRAFASAEALLQHERNSPAHRNPPAETSMPAEAASPVVPPPSQDFALSLVSLRLAAILTGAATSSLPPTKAEGCSDCKQCSRTFVSAEALLQHERDSPAHRHAPTEAASFVRPPTPGPRNPDRDYRSSRPDILPPSNAQGKRTVLL